MAVSTQKRGGAPGFETKPAKPGIAPTEQKSMKMSTEELGEKIKACVKEAISENEESKADGEDGSTYVAEDRDISALIEEAMELVREKRKSRKEDGEELGEITADEIMEAVQEIAGAGEEAKAEGDEGEEKEAGANPEEKRKSRSSACQSKKKVDTPAQRKYSSVFLTGGSPTVSSAKKVPELVQLARAVKCLDVFGRHDPEAAAYYAKKNYGDETMAREFKALGATNPSAGGYLIPEVYLDQIIELLYSKTVIIELGAQKVPMANGNLTIPKMTGGARATWGGEARKIAKSQPAFGNIKLSSKRLEAIIPQTRELLMSTNFSADQMFANDLTRRMELGLDFGALFGTGSEFQPTGIFNNTGVEKVDVAKLGNADLADADGKITADFPVFVRSKLLEKNVDDLHLGWAFNSVLEGYYMNMKTTTGAYLYRDEMNGGKLLGFPYRTTNQIPTDGNGRTKQIFGNWNDLLIGEQMGLETYTTLDGSWVDEEGTQHNAFEENLAATRALMYVDVAARHAESFLCCANIKAR